MTTLNRLFVPYNVALWIKSMKATHDSSLIRGSADDNLLQWEFYQEVSWTRPPQITSVHEPRCADCPRPDEDCPKSSVRRESTVRRIPAFIDSKSLHDDGRYRSLSPDETFCHSVTPIFSSWQRDLTAVSFPQPVGPLRSKMPFVFFIFLTDSVIHLFSSCDGSYWHSRKNESGPKWTDQKSGRF